RRPGGGAARCRRQYAAPARRVRARGRAEGRSGLSTVATESSVVRPSRRPPRRARGAGLCPPRVPDPDPRPRAGTARPPTLPRGLLRRLPGRPPRVSLLAAGLLLAYAQHASVLQIHQEMRARL